MQVQYYVVVYKDGKIHVRCVYADLALVNMIAECFLDVPDYAVAIERQVCSRPWL